MSRRASLRVAHSSKCAIPNATTLESASKTAGCTCQPSYFTFHRARDGRVVKGERVHDKQSGQRMLTKVQHELDSGTARQTKNRGVAEIHVERTYNAQDGDSKPKSGKRREVHVIERGVLENWVQQVGVRPEEELVFRGPLGGEHVNGKYLTGKLLLAMEEAGISRVGERGVKRDFHSFRHTYARDGLRDSVEPSVCRG